MKPNDIDIGGHEQQQLDGFAWLRFEPALEEEFRQFNYRAFRQPRQFAMRLLTLTQCAFLGMDLYFAVQAYKIGDPVAQSATTGVAVLRLLALLLAAFFAAQLRHRQDIDFGERWLPVVLIVTALDTLAVLLMHGLMHQVLGMPLLMDGVVLIMIVALFPQGYQVRASMAIAVVGALLSWVCIPLLVDAQLRQDFLSSLPLQVTVLVGMLAIRYFQELSTRAQFLAQGALRHMASTDSLTGLANRRVFESHVLQGLQQAQREGQHAALLLIDIDHFKKYNDHYGHPAGDAALKAVAQALARHAARPMDAAARVGGEEFALFFYAVDGNFVQTIGGAICRDIESNLALPHTASTTAAVVTVSIGVALNRPGDDFDAAYQRADMALYQAKSQDRNRATVFRAAAG